MSYIWRGKKPTHNESLKIRTYEDPGFKTAMEQATGILNDNFGEENKENQ